MPAAASLLRIALALSAAASSAALAEVRKLEQGNRIIAVEWETSPGQSLLEATFDVQLRDPRTPDPAGGRSMSGAATLNCPRGLVRLTRLVIYADPGLKGAEVRRYPPQANWVRPEPTSVLSAVMQGVCAASSRSASRPPAETSRPVPASPSSIATAPAPEKRVRASTPEPRSNGPIQGSFRIQVGSFPTRAGAEAGAAALRQSAPELPSAHFETARVGPATYHRVLIDGFASAAAAEAACRGLRASGTACLVKSAARR